MAAAEEAGEGTWIDGREKRLFRTSPGLARFAGGTTVLVGRLLLRHSKMRGKVAGLSFVHVAAIFWRSRRNLFVKGVESVGRSADPRRNTAGATFFAPNRDK
jgi:hypothetical protein